MLYPNFADLIKLQTASTGGMLKNKYNLQANTAGDYSSVFRGHGMELDNIRPYVMGDDVRHIDWRVSARTLTTHVKTFQAETDRKIILLVDSNAYMRFGTRGTFKSIQAARAAALLAGMGFKNRDRVGGVVFGDIAEGIKFFPPTRNKTSAWRLLQLLCAEEVQQEQTITLTNALEHIKHSIPTGSLLFIFTDISAVVNTTEKILSALKAKADLIVLPIIDPIDHLLPEVSNIICSNTSAEKVTITKITAKIRNQYNRLAALEEQDFSKLLKKCKIRRINLYTNQPVHQSINYGLQHLRYL